jgi:hypothetical protein
VEYSPADIISREWDDPVIAQRTPGEYSGRARLVGIIHDTFDHGDTSQGFVAA